MGSKNKGKKGKLHRPPVDEVAKNGYFGQIAKGWPYEGMFDENQGLTSSVYGQDQYRLNEGPPDLVHRKSSTPTIRAFADKIVKSDFKPNATPVSDMAERWLQENDPTYVKKL